MGNYQFAVNPPRNGQVCMIVENDYTSKEKIPQSIIGYGAKVLAEKSGKLYCSNSNLPSVVYTVVKLPNGTRDVYFSSSLKPA